MLRDLKILDFTEGALSLGTRILADLGAFVVKLESPDSIHSLTKDALYIYHNVNKHIITLNLNKKAGRELFLKLIEKVDVFVEDKGSLPPIVTDYEDIKKRNSQLIYISVTGFGKRGSKKHNHYDHATISASSGQMYLTGKPRGKPLCLPLDQTYYTASLHVALAILLAFRKRIKEKTGTFGDISIQECAIFASEDALIRYLSEGVVPGREGKVSKDGVFCILPCKDGCIQMTLFYQWETLAELVSEDGLKFSLEKAISGGEKNWKKERALLLRELKKWTMRYRAKELFEKGQEMHFPWAPIFTPEEVLNSPQLKARGFLKRVRYRKNDLLLPIMPYIFFDFKPRVRFLDPTKTNREIYCKFLGIPKDEFARFRKAGVI